jgi:threonyl-tRNA synthetase
VTSLALRASKETSEIMLDPNDHRSLGQRLDLWHFEEDAPGMVFWHPRGYCLYRLLEQAARARVLADGYEEVRTPQILRRAIWEASGHWRHFNDGMFHVADEAQEAAIKPVSCPGHIQIVKRRAPSYRELPLRLAEFGVVHRDEPSGTLHGLLRLRQFTQDDGHVFCEEQQVAVEVERFVRSIFDFYRAFGFDDLAVALATRPEQRAGSDAAWDFAESALAAAADRASLKYERAPGGGAFYGPKLEFALTDRLGRSWQCGTIQLDLVMPERFGLRYTSASGVQRPLLMLHRALFGSLERFLAVLLEHYAGALPPWVAPLQVQVIPVSNAQRERAAEVTKSLSARGVRADLDARDETLAKRIGDSHRGGAPLAVIIGERELTERTLTLRGRDGQRSLPIAEAEALIEAQCRAPDFARCAA